MLELCQGDKPRTLQWGRQAGGLREPGCALYVSHCLSYHPPGQRPVSALSSSPEEEGVRSDHEKEKTLVFSTLFMDSSAL